MSEGNSTQAPNPPSAGQSDVNVELEKLKQEKAELERAVNGIKKDLLSEREKRQQLEAAKANPVPAGNPAADPVDQLFVQKTAPLIQQAIAYEKAKSFVASKINADPDEVEQTSEWRELVDYAQRRGIVGATPDRTAKLAWTLMQQEKEAEKKAKEAAEAERLRAVNSNASVSSSVSAPASGSPKQLTNKEIEKMSLAEYSKVRELIAKGEIKVVG